MTSTGFSFIILVTIGTAILIGSIFVIGAKLNRLTEQITRTIVVVIDVLATAFTIVCVLLTKYEMNKAFRGSF